MGHDRALWEAGLLATSILVDGCGSDGGGAHPADVAGSGGSTVAQAGAAGQAGQGEQGGGGGEVAAPKTTTTSCALDVPVPPRLSGTNASGVYGAAAGRDGDALYLYLHTHEPPDAVKEVKVARYKVASTSPCSLVRDTAFGDDGSVTDESFKDAIGNMGSDKAGNIYMVGRAITRV